MLFRHYISTKISYDMVLDKSKNPVFHLQFFPDGVSGSIYTINNERSVGHSGGVVSGYRSLLYLLPSHNLGLFVSDNGSSNISGKLIDQFLDRYFPVDKNSPSCQPFPENRQ